MYHIDLSWIPRFIFNPELLKNNKRFLQNVNRALSSIAEEVMAILGCRRSNNLGVFKMYDNKFLTSDKFEKVLEREDYREDVHRSRGHIGDKLWFHSGNLTPKMFKMLVREIGLEIK